MARSSDAYGMMLEFIKKGVIESIREEIKMNEDGDLAIDLRDYDIYISDPDNPEAQLLVLEVRREEGIYTESMDGEDIAFVFNDVDVSDLCYILECIEGGESGNKG